MLMLPLKYTIKHRAINFIVFAVSLLLLSFLPQTSRADTATKTAGETASGDHVSVRWLAPDGFASGQTERVGFYFEVDDGWHVYWRNAGDSGSAPRFKVTTKNATTADIEWPAPARLPIEHLTNLGYEGNVAYLLPVTPNDDATHLTLNANLEWLVCKIECIPGGGTMALSRPVGDKAQWQTADLQRRDKFLSQIPNGENHSWTASLSPLGDTQLQLNLLGKHSDAPPLIFPLDGDLLTATQPQVTPTDGGWQYVFERVAGATLPDATGFVVSNGEQAWSLSQVGINTTALPNAPAQPLWLLIVLAFAGGIVLNLMPCVLPVLSIKVFGLVQTPPQKRLHEALLYSAGVLATFASLGGLLLLLRYSGSAIGWGFQLQSAPVILALIALFWLMALSFSGVFEFGNRLMNMAGKQRGGAFVTGMLAVFVATPCTGPFMGVALGAATVLPALSAMAIFLSLGAGLAAPFVLLCLSPKLFKLLPKPGAWMETLRQFLAFPLYLTVIWLLWVLGQLQGDNGWLVGSLLMLALVFALWLAKSKRKVLRWTAVGVAMLAVATAFVGVQKITPTTTTTSTSNWQAFDPQAIQQARNEGKAVFVDYTAAWCITCQVNKKLVLDTEAVQALFKANKVLLVRADWTHQDPKITASLASFGRNSLPVYAWYPAGATQAKLLPQVLQTQMIEDLF